MSVQWSFKADSPVCSQRPGKLNWLQKELQPSATLLKQQELASMQISQTAVWDFFKLASWPQNKWGNSATSFTGADGLQSSAWRASKEQAAITEVWTQSEEHLGFSLQFHIKWTVCSDQLLILW